MKPHGFLVYLAPELYMAIVKLQADKGLGRVYPVLYTINEGLYKLGYIKKEVYEIYEKKYSEPLIQEKPKPLTKERLEEQKKLRELEKLFSQVIERWPKLSEKARIKHIAKAKTCLENVPNAKLVLALATENDKPIENEVKP